MEYTVREVNGDTEWYYGDKLHKENGPAIERADGQKEWWIDGKRHREDGAAIEFADGSKKWYFEGKSLQEDEYDAIIKAKNEPEEVIEPLRFNYTVNEVKDWLEDFSSVVISPKSGQIRWANPQTQVELWHLLQEIEDENNGLHAFVNDLGESRELEVPEDSGVTKIKDFFTFFCVTLFIIAVVVYFVNQFYNGQ
jgi:hypothetical protein